MDDTMVVSELTGENIFKVHAHFFEFSTQDLKALDFVSDSLGKLTLRSILDISQKMFNANFFSFSCANRTGNMNELSVHVSFIVNFLLSEIGFSWQTDALALLHIADNKHRVCIVSSNDFIDVNVSLLNLWAS